MKKFKKHIIRTQAAMAAALLVGTKEAEANTFSDIAGNITRSVEELRRAKEQAEAASLARSRCRISTRCTARRGRLTRGRSRSPRCVR